MSGPKARTEASSPNSSPSPPGLLVVHPLPPVSARLRAARQALGRSQSVVAVAAGLDPSTLARIERGAHSPTTETLYRLACVLDLDDLTAALRPYVGEPVA